MNKTVIRKMKDQTKGVPVVELNCRIELQN